jgi:hypothetical protein
MGFFIIFNSNSGKDEPQTLHYAITQNCSMGADGGHIDYTRVGELKQVMADASTAVVGRPMAVSASGLGVDEIEPDFRLDFVEWIQAPRCPAYRRRMSAWEARIGREVIPYR